jgi:hypothetical protein
LKKSDDKKYGIAEVTYSSKRSIEAAIAKYNNKLADGT